MLAAALPFTQLLLIQQSISCICSTGKLGVEAEYIELGALTQVLGMRLIRKASLGPGQHECAYMSFKPFERDGSWIELLLADPAKVSRLSTCFVPSWFICLQLCPFSR